MLFRFFGNEACCVNFLYINLRELLIFQKKISVVRFGKIFLLGKKGGCQGVKGE